MNETRLNNNVVQNKNPLLAEKIRKCPECGSKNLVTDYKEAKFYCADCGAIIAENIVDLGPEWRAFDKEQRTRIRTGPPDNWLQSNKGLKTAHPDAEKIPNIHLPRAHYIYQTTSSEKTLISAIIETDRICSALYLPADIKQETARLCYKAQKENLFQGRGIETIASAIVYIVCKQQKISRTLSEIEKVSKTSRKTIRKAATHLVVKMRLKVRQNSSTEFMPRFCSELGVNNQVTELAIQIAIDAEEESLANGRSLRGIAGAAIYISCLLRNESHTQKNISKVCGISVPILKNRAEEISKKLELSSRFSFLDKT